jgi:uncharacterized membrane protein
MSALLFVSNRALLIAFMICAAIRIALIGRGMIDQGWLDALLLILAVLSTIAGLSPDLPLQNVIVASVLVAALSGLIEMIGVKTGIPFGRFSYTGHAGVPILGILPWPIPLAWVVIVLNSRQVARLILRRWPVLPARGLWTIGLGSLLALAIDTVLEPYASKVRGFWIWRTSPTQLVWHGAPWYHFLAWAVVASLILIVTIPWLVNKRSTGNSPVNFQPLAMWLIVDILLSAADAVHGPRDSAAVGLVIAVAAAALGFWRARTWPGHGLLS